MAHSPETKASVIAAVVVEGKTYEEAEEEFGVPKGTISKWVKQVSKKGNTSPENETKRNKSEILVQRDEDEFDRRLKSLLIASLDMVEAWAKTCQEPEFIRQNPGGVRELGESVLERCDRIVHLVRGPDTPE